ncbi:FtsX-like permease family protein [Cellulomonas sp. URHB0016]
MTLTAVRTAARATGGDAVLVARRRARQDAGLLVLTGGLLTATVLLSLAVPRLVSIVADDGVQAAVALEAPQVDLTADPGPRGRIGEGEDVAQLDANAAADMREALPPVLRDLTREAVTSAATRPATVTFPDVTYGLRFVHVGTATSGDRGLVTWLDGAAPVRQPESDVHVLQVGVSDKVADRTGLTTGARFSLSEKVQVLVTGVFTPADPRADVWSGQDDVLSPQAASPASGQAAKIGFLVSDASLPDLLGVPGRNVVTTYRFPVDPERLTAPATTAVEKAVARLQANALPLTGNDGRTPRLTTTLDTVLHAVDERLAASRAQATLLLVGLGTAGALALVLAARLLVLRREPVLLAERARGASVASVALRALVESVPLALVAAALGAGGAELLVPGGRGSWLVAGLVLAAAVLAPAAWSALLVSRAWTGQRLPANRADRERLLGRRRARRVVVELVLVAVAAAALVSVRSRGLTQTRTGGVDPLLAATPVLLAAAATVVAVRLLPPLLRGISRAAARRRGLVPVVATARAARTAGTAVPLLTLTVSVALVVFCATTAVTVRGGQARAADLTVGAQVRIDGPTLRPSDVESLRSAPGVTAVAGAVELGRRTFGEDAAYDVRLVAVDAADLARARTAHGLPVPDELATLGEDTGETVRVLATPDVATAATLIEPQVRVVDTTVRVDVVGTVDEVAPVPGGGTDAAEAAVAPTVVGDWSRLSAVAGEELKVQSIWVDGPGAVEAVRAAGFADADGITVTERDPWLREWQASPFNAGLLALLVSTGLALAGYAVVALALTVVGTARERARTVSALRTQGLAARTAGALTFGELAPLAVTAVLLGSAIGMGVPWVLAGALGLDLLAGAPGAAVLHVDWRPVAGAAVVVLLALLVAVLVESVVRRRDQLGQVLRVGER